MSSSPQPPEFRPPGKTSLLNSLSPSHFLEPLLILGDKTGKTLLVVLGGEGRPALTGSHSLSFLTWYFSRLLSLDLFPEIFGPEISGHFLRSTVRVSTVRHPKLYKNDISSPWPLILRPWRHFLKYILTDDPDEKHLGQLLNKQISEPWSKPL